MANATKATNGHQVDAADKTVHDIIILGSGPAGYSAALYAARAHRQPILITGNEIGGQVALTYEVENYPGFPEGLTGPDLVERMQKHAEKFGTKIQMDYITEVDLRQRPFRLKGYSDEYYAKALIISTGATPRKLGLEQEVRLTGRGVSYCGTCDGFFFRGKEVVVVGGGDSALEEADFLTKFATKVTIIHRRDSFRAGATLQARVARNDKIGVIWNSVVEEVLGDDKVTGVRLKNIETGEIWEQPTDGVFIFIGHIPNNQLYEGQLDIDNGYIVIDSQMRTSIPGVWAAGEAADSVFRQVITSAGMGAAAAIAADRWLSEHESEELSPTHLLSQQADVPA